MGILKTFPVIASVAKQSQGVRLLRYARNDGRRGRNDGFAVTLCLCAFVPLCLSSVVAAKRTQIVILKSQDIKPYNDVVAGFSEVLNAKKTNYYAYQYSIKDNEDNLDTIIAKIKDNPPQLILTIGSKATRVVKDNLKGIPTVFALVIDNEALTEDMAGVGPTVPAERQFSLIQELFPQAKRIGIVHNSFSRVALEEAKEKAKKANLELVTAKALKEKDVYAVAEELFGSDIDVLWTLADPIILTPQTLRFLIYETKKQKIPFIGLSPYFVRAGAFGAIYCDEIDIGRQTGEIALEVINGKSPKAIGTPPPRQAKIYINPRTTKIIGVKIPENMKTRIIEVN